MIVRKSICICKIFLIGFAYFSIYLSSVFAEETGIRTKIQSFAHNGFEPEIYGIRIDGAVSKESIIKRFGNPLKAMSKEEPDLREPGIINEILNYEYQGLIIKMERPTYSSTYWISEIILISSDYNLKYGLKIGQSKSVFLRQLGNHEKGNGKSLIYNVDIYATIGDIDFAQHATVTIEFNEREKAEKISWYYFAD